MDASPEYGRPDALDGSGLGAARRARKRADILSIVIVAWFVGAAVAWFLARPVDYILMLPVYVWVLFGRGGRVLRGSWPAVALLEDVQTERGVKVLFAITWVVHTVSAALELRAYW